MIITNDNHIIIKNHFGNQWHSRYPEISMVRNAYSFVL